MTPIRAKALAALRDGRVTVGVASGTVTGDADSSPALIMARVFSSRPDRRIPYWVRHDGLKGWSCTCSDESCAHVAAVQLVTGYESAAAK